jgi:segregation and condensation protein B
MMGVTLWPRRKRGKDRLQPAPSASEGFGRNREVAYMGHPFRSAGVLERRGGMPRDHARPLVLRLLEGVREEAHGDPMARPPKLALVEAALMLAEEPVPARKLAQVAGLRDGHEARRLVARLQEMYDRESSAFQVEELAGGYQLLTRAEFYPWLARHRRAGGEFKLTPAARETLAIIAYRQPIMRADVEAIRGVQCGDILRLLMEKGLVRIAGRDDSLGRPVLYGTTKKFLQLLGLKALSDLPRADELRRPSRAKPAGDEEM